MIHFENIETVVKSGYAFLKQINDTETIYENKFTGVRLVYNFGCGSYKVIVD